MFKFFGYRYCQAPGRFKDGKPPVIGTWDDFVGIAQIVNDPNLKNKYWKEEWDAYYRNRDKEYILIKVIPTTMEIVDYTNGIVATSETWGAPTVYFDSQE